MSEAHAARLPTLATLATLAELTARCAAAPDLRTLAEILASSAKWVVSAHHVSLVVRDGQGGYVWWPSGQSVVPVQALALALSRRSTVKTGTVSARFSPVVVQGMTAWVVVPLMDPVTTEVLGALLVAARDEAYLAELDSGVLHLLALNVAGSIRMAELLASERAAVKTRDAMVATVVHDLRNPLAAASAIVELLREEQPSDSPILADLDTVLQSLGSMSSIAEEMLDAARLQAGEPIPLRRERADLRQILEAALAQVSRVLRSSYSLELDLTAEPLAGRIDGGRMRRVLDNLLSNAMKYTRAGGVIRVRAAREGEVAVVEVTDTGIGIPAADLPKMFRRFHRAGNVGAIRGTGLGLAGAYEITRSHGGTLSVRSEEGVGSTFRLELPLGPTAEPVRTNEAATRSP